MTEPLEQKVSTSSSGAGRSLSRALVFGVVGLIAAALAYVAISGIGYVFRLPPEIAALGIGAIPGQEDQNKIAAANRVIEYKHFALWLGAGGAILGALLCLAQSASRGGVASKRGLLAVVVGAVTGGVFGAIAGLLAVFMDVTLRNNLEPGLLGPTDTKIMMMHAMTWLILGAGIGLGCALASANGGRELVGTAIGAGFAGLLGGVLFPFLVSILDPLADPSLPMPQGMFGRALWIALPFVLIGLVVGRRQASVASPPAVA
jgi:hypothetical protein